LLPARIWALTVLEAAVLALGLRVKVAARVAPCGLTAREPPAVASRKTLSATTTASVIHAGARVMRPLARSPMGGRLLVKMTRGASASAMPKARRWPGL
jgi:hypothetical protein